MFIHPVIWENNTATTAKYNITAGKGAKIPVPEPNEFRLFYTGNFDTICLQLCVTFYFFRPALNSLSQAWHLARCSLSLALRSFSAFRHLQFMTRCG